MISTQLAALASIANDLEQAEYGISLRAQDGIVWLAYEYPETKNTTGSGYYHTVNHSAINWRIKIIEDKVLLTIEDPINTTPLTLESKRVYELGDPQLHQQLLDAIQEIDELVARYTELRTAASDFRHKGVPLR